jgi:hypothetical protein
MRALVVLLLCAACNNLLGLDKATERPSSDALAADAPRFPCDLSRGYAQPMKSIPACTDYTSDANGQVIVVAMCGAVPQQMFQGAPGAQLQPAVFDDANPGTTLDSPRLSPAGDQLIVRATTPGLQNPVSFRVYQHQADGTWGHAYPIMFPDVTQALDPTDTVSTITTGTKRHILLLHNIVTTHELREYAEGMDPTGAWVLKNVYEPRDFDLLDMTDPYLSEDGLGLVFAGIDLRYAVREDIRDSFVLPASLVTWLVSSEKSPFLTADCTSLFISSNSDTLRASLL